MAVIIITVEIVYVDCFTATIIMLSTQICDYIKIMYGSEFFRKGRRERSKRKKIKRRSLRKRKGGRIWGMVMERREGERKRRGKERDTEFSPSSNLNIFRSISEEEVNSIASYIGSHLESPHFQCTCVYSFSYCFLCPSLNHLALSLLIITYLFSSIFHFY